MAVRSGCKAAGCWCSRWWDGFGQAIKRRISGQPRPRNHALDIAQYGTKTAFGIGIIHGIGAETGSQALLAGAAGATTPQSGSLMLLMFALGLVMSNSLIALFSLAGFVSSSTKRNVYVVGVLVGVFSLVVGVLFLVGHGADLPDLQGVLNAIFGELE
jgi:high-affinity nickel-transport protein